MNALFAATVISLFAAAPQGPTLTEPSSDMKFQQMPTIDGKPFRCLGTGIRKKAVFRVYAMVFCVAEPAGKEQLAQYFRGEGAAHSAKKGEALADALLDDPKFFQSLRAMPVEKAAELVFIRDVGKDKMKDAFRESLTKAVGKGEKERVERFVDLLDRDLKERDVIQIRTEPEGTLHLRLGETHKSLADPLLAGAIWEVYLGPDPVAPALKKSVARGVAQLQSTP